MTEPLTRIEKMNLARAKPEVEAKRLANLRARLTDPAFRAKANARLLETAHTPEARAKMSAANKAQWADPVIREQRRAALKAMANRPEIRADRSERMKKRQEERRATERRREQARAIVADAGLPLLKETVEFVARMIEGGAGVSVILPSLRRAA